MKSGAVIYLCPRCFEICESDPAVHHHRMLRVEPDRLSIEQRSPLINSGGRLHSRAPRWFLEAVDWLPAHWARASV